MTENNDKTIWNFLKKEIWLIGIVIGAVLAVYIPIGDIKTQIAVIQNQNEQIIKKLDQNENNVVRLKQSLNITFSDIYKKLGSVYIDR